uniref:D-aminoacyl-tRNA deacylase n=1 Tax=Moniliophthora roreri TaxID=221103 RepID=A0A0W0G220_MONRR
MVDATTIINKILSLRVFDDQSDGKMWRKSVRDIDGDVLCVSQFTLLANTTKGNKPDFHRAMAAEPSRTLYASFLDSLRNSYKPEKVKGVLDPKLRIAASEEYFLDGVFGAMMSVSLTNEGPVTLTIDSRKFEYIDTNALPAKINKKGGSSPSSAAQPSDR